jgi:hypothetical protein
MRDDFERSARPTRQAGRGKARALSCPDKMAVGLEITGGALPYAEFVGGVA